MDSKAWKTNEAPRLAGRTAVVTGSGRGIGRAVAEMLAQQGASVVINDIDADVAAETATDLERRGARVTVCAGDVTERDFGERLVGAAVSAFDGIDIIVNNAGYTWDSTIQNTSDDQFQAMLDVHLVAPFRILRAAQPHLRRLRSSDVAENRHVVRKVVNVSSLSGVAGNSGQVSYATAKAGISGMTKSLAKEWGRYAVTVNAVAFGLVRTRLTEATSGVGASVRIGDRTVRVGVSEELLENAAAGIPLGRTGTVQEAAGAICLLTYPESDYVSGQVVLCAGGFHM